MRVCVRAAGVCYDYCVTFNLLIYYLIQVYELPQVNTIEEAQNSEAAQRHMGYIIGRSVVEIVSFSRYSCKLLIYLATGRQFREHLLRLLFKCNNRSLARQMSNTTMTSITRNSSYKPSAEKTTLLSRGRTFTNDSITFDQSNMSNNNGVTWTAEPCTRSSTLKEDSCESCFTLKHNSDDNSNNNNNVDDYHKN